LPSLFQEALGELSKSFEELDDFELIIAPATSTTSKGEGGKENAEATKADEPMME
jgi:hypothetical protein